MGVFGKIAKVVGTAAPLVGGLLGGPAGSAVGGMVASALGVENTPEAIEQALQKPEALAKLREIEEKHRHELETLQIQAETARQLEINKTYRAELASEDSYVRRARPTWLYVMCGTWAIQTLSLTAAVFYAIAKPEASKIIGELGGLVGALTFMWSIALTVAGGYMYKRSQDKQVAAGQTPVPGILASLAARVIPGRGVAS